VRGRGLLEWEGREGTGSKWDGEREAPFSRGDEECKHERRMKDMSGPISYMIRLREFLLGCFVPFQLSHSQRLPSLVKSFGIRY